MNKLFKIFVASVLVLTMCVPAISFATGELNACGTYADIKQSILAYPDGSFQGEDSNFVTNKVSSGFGYVQISGGTINAVATENTLTYHKGVGGKAADDRSAKLSAYGKNAILAEAELNESNAETQNYIAMSSGDVLVIEADLFKTDSKQSIISFQTGNSYKYGTTIYLNEDYTISRRVFTDGSNSTTTAFENASYKLNQWNRLKIVYDRDNRKGYVFFNGVKIGEDVLYDNITKNGLTNIKFTQTGGAANAPSSLYIDDVEIYLANSLDSALSTDKTLATDLVSKVSNCTVDNVNDKITYTTGEENVLVSDLKAAVQGNISGVLRNGMLVTDGSAQNGDAVVVLSEDGRTYRYYTLEINVVIVNVLEGADIIANSWVWEDYEVDPANMFDGKEDTYYTPKYAASDDGEIVLDLGSTKTFNQISVLNGTTQRGRYIRFSVSVSNDNATFTDVVKDAVIQNEKGQDQIINFKETSARYVKLNFNIHNAEETTKMYLSEIKLFKKARPENICENVAINAASTYSNNTSNSAGYYAWIDGDADTMYMSGTLTSGTYILDLGQRKNFDKLYLKMGGNSYYLTSCDVKVSVSNDNNTYSTVKEFSGIVHNSEINETLAATMSGRYIKLEFTNISQSSRAARLNMKEFGLYYGGNEADPLDTGYTCLITRNAEGTKLNATVDASAAISEGFGGVLIGAVYDKDWKLLKATILDDAFAVAANSEFSYTYELDYVSGTKYAKVFFWNSLTELVPMYGHNEYRE